MVETARGARDRSGCALALGILLILVGVLFLAHNLNLIGWSSLRFVRSGAVWFSDYWPLLLVVWGAFKVYRRFTAPERARVGALEVILLLLVVGFGLTLRAARHVLDQVSSGSSFEPWHEFLELELLGAPAHRFTEERSFDLQSATAVVEVENLEGSVSVTASGDGQIRAVLTKRIHRRSETDAARIAEAVSMDFDSDAERARLTVRNPSRGSRAETDLTLTVPRGASLRLKNRRGPVTVSGLSGAVDVETSHGDVELRDLSGGIRVGAQRARIRVENVAGSVELRNRHGAIDVRGVQGELSAGTSHGPLVAADVTGSVRLDNRHASVRARGIGANVEVAGENTEVSVEKASGDVVIRTTHEPIFVRDVSGRVTIGSRNAKIQVLEAGGDVDVEASGEPVTVAGARGAVKVASRPSEVTVDGAAGPVVIEGADTRVRVTDFGSDLTVLSSHAEVSASTSRLSGNVDLESTYGDVVLTLPRDGSARIVASTRDGDLKVELAGLELKEDTDGRGRRWEGTLGEGTHRVSLATTHGDVRVRETRP